MNKPRSNQLRWPRAPRSVPSGILPCVCVCGPTLKDNDVQSKKRMGEVEELL